MLAEAIHSYADCANQALLLWGLREGAPAARPRPPARLRQGDLLLELHRRADAVQHGRPVLDLRRRAQAAGAEPIENAWVAIAILVFGIAAESVSLWGCLREVNKDRGEQGLWRWFRASRQSELLVVFAEDIAALGGLTLALGFIGLAHRHRQPGVGRRRVDLHRRRAGARRRAGRRRGQGAADRPERRGPRPRSACAAHLAEPRRGRDRLQPADAAARPRRHGRGQGEDAAGSRRRRR